MFPSVRYLGLAAAFGLAGLLPVGAAAAVATSTVTITFDEPYVSTLEDILQTNPYATLGATFVAGSGAQVGIIRRPGDYNKYDLLPGEDPNNRTVHFDTSPLDVLVQLTAATTSFSFDYRRPNGDGSINVSIYSGGGLVHAFPAIDWTFADGWVTFHYDGAFGAIDGIQFTSSKKNLIDNLSFEVTAVPLPAPVVLLGSALVLLRGRRRALRTAH